MDFQQGNKWIEQAGEVTVHQFNQRLPALGSFWVIFGFAPFSRPTHQILCSATYKLLISYIEIWSFTQIYLQTQMLFHLYFQGAFHGYFGKPPRHVRDILRTLQVPGQSIGQLIKFFALQHINSLSLIQRFGALHKFIYRLVQCDYSIVKAQRKRPNIVMRVPRTMKIVVRKANI